MAAAYDIPVIPHGSSVFSYHLQMAYPNCPMGELAIKKILVGGYFSIIPIISYDIPVIPHGSSVFSYHLQMAYPNCPMGELENAGFIL